MDKPRRTPAHSKGSTRPSLVGTDGTPAESVLRVARTTMIVDVSGTAAQASAEFKTSIEYDGFCTLYRLLDEDGVNPNRQGDAAQRLLGTCGEPMN